MKFSEVLIQITFSGKRGRAIRALHPLHGVGLRLGQFKGVSFLFDWMKGLLMLLHDVLGRRHKRTPLTLQLLVVGGLMPTIILASHKICSTRDTMRQLGVLSVLFIKRHTKVTSPALKMFWHGDHSLCCSSVILLPVYAMTQERVHIDKEFVTSITPGTKADLKQGFFHTKVERLYL